MPVCAVNGVSTNVPPPVAVTQGGGVLTINIVFAVCVRAPPVPVMVKAEVPSGVELVVVTVSVDEPLPETEAGLKAPLAPIGKPETDRLVVPLKPPVPVMVAV